MELAEISVVKQTRLAAAWLTDTAKIWYMNTYKDVKPLPSLEVFLKAFKEQHSLASTPIFTISLVSPTPQPMPCHDIHMFSPQKTSQCVLSLR